MNIPLNGRIAIIDDKPEQVLPLINELAKKRCPYLYYTGDLKYLPSECDVTNDIRILFLDINLIDDADHESKVLKGRLIPVLKRVISKDNYPYILIYWSRHEKEHGDLVRNIFEDELRDRKPIAYIREEAKLKYIDIDGERVDDYEEKVDNLFTNISTLLSQFKEYDHLLNWENQVHISADKTLQDVFSAYHNQKSWSDNAGFLINKLGESYSGKSTYKKQSVDLKVISSFQAFNNVFFDTLEYYVNNFKSSIIEEVKYDESAIQKDSIFSINKKLLISDDKEIIEYSGTITQDLNPISDKVFGDLLNNSFNRSKVKEETENDPSNKEKNITELKKLIEDVSSKKRKEIRANWKKIYLVVTPLCDFVQGKCYNARVVKGMLIKADIINYIDVKSEALFVSPKFKYEDEIWILVLHFRYFFTAPGSKGCKFLTPLFRVRQSLLAEVQSKLARHVSRQGILFVDEL